MILFHTSLGIFTVTPSCVASNSHFRRLQIDAAIILEQFFIQASHPGTRVRSEFA
jgi:hypothetical protein